MDASLLRALFHLDVPVLEKIIRPILVYLFLIVGLRLAGKRELAQRARKPIRRFLYTGHWGEGASIIS